MSSPEIYDEARPRIEALAGLLDLPVAWPNESFRDEPEPFTIRGDGVRQANYWLAVEISGDLSAPLGAFGEQWEEGGAVLVHVMCPTGAGIQDGLKIRKEIANAFRERIPAAIVWRSATFDPGGPSSQDGTWYPLTLRLNYVFTDHVPDPGEIG